MFELLNKMVERDCLCLKYSVQYRTCSWVYISFYLILVSMVILWYDGGLNY